MNAALPLARPLAEPSSVAGAIRTLPLAVLSCLVVAVAMGAVFMANQPAVAAVALPMAEQPRDLAPAARARSRCEGCGVVEAMHRTEPAGDQPEAYEFTVRLRDGSSRVSRDANPGKWNIGDHIMLIGGATAPRR